MNPKRGLSRLPWLGLSIVLLFATGGCEDSFSPVITKLDATPSCDVITTHVEPVLDDNGNPTFDDNGDPIVNVLGDWLEVRFFGRASGGNNLSDPTGGNSPLKWSWRFGDGGTTSDVVAPTHRYTEPGTYTVTLRVEDNDGDSDEASIKIFVGASFTDLDIVIVDADVDEPFATFSTTSTGVESLDGWAATFHGHLQTNCNLSGLFEQFLWRWHFSDGDSIADLSDPTHVFPPVSGSFDATLEITETESKVSRSTQLSVSNPVAVGIRQTDATIVGGSITQRVSGWLLTGVTGLSGAIEYDAAILSLQSATFTADLPGAGFNATVDGSTPGMITFDATGATGLSLGDGEIGLLDLSFTVNPGTEEDNRYNVAFTSFSATLEGGTDAVTTAAGAAVDVRPDCNGNGIADNLDISDHTSFDTNDDGIPDECQN